MEMLSETVSTRGAQSCRTTDRKGFVLQPALVLVVHAFSRKEELPADAQLEKEEEFFSLQSFTFEVATWPGNKHCGRNADVCPSSMAIFQMCIISSNEIRLAKWLETY